MRQTPGQGAEGLLLDGVILRTYLPTDPEHPGYAARQVNMGDTPLGVITPSVTTHTLYAPGLLRAVLCDVLTYGHGRFSSLRLVPVLQPRGTRSAADRWIPRASSRSANGGPAVLPRALLPGEPANTITPPGDLDGELVLVGFKNNDFSQPIILGSQEHPHAEQAIPTWRATTPAQGPADERVIRHRGSKVTIDSDGNVTVDATGASAGVLTPTGDEVPRTTLGGTVGWVKVISGPSHLYLVSNGVTAELEGSTTVKLGAAAVRPANYGDLAKKLLQGITDILNTATIMSGVGPLPVTGAAAASAQYPGLTTVGAIVAAMATDINALLSAKVKVE